ncbi:porin [Jannaschia seohaensis]|uniref:Outer membrane protein OmpU n=1 Tax=Jannaschia seohaensis TaxID=475081 RepID=A0A2Y9A1Y8_9RHOB|nr:porin [Jannaschia seohaensis]PWJ22283.1 outer membrane protein OmpU [Jannaschia seohaensis]SSA38561.1 outer membrane protein OmpU [Jannaschia seohaensis]
MKSILFASTALVAFTGAAAAQGVAVSGFAEMGFFGATDVDTQFHTDIDVTFTMSGETDNGLTFGASIDLDESDGDPSPAFDGDTQGGETIFLSGNFGTITMGDTDGALDWAVTEVLFNSGSIVDNEEHIGYNGNAGHDGSLGNSDGQVLRYDYSFGDFGVAVSAEQIPGVGADAGDDTAFGIGFRYGLDLGGSSINLGLGYQGSDIADVLALSANGSFGGGFTAGLSYMNFDVDGGGAGDYDHVGIGVGYTTGAISLHANYGVYDYDGGGDDEGFGLTAGYDLGGGAVIQFGYGYNDPDGADSFDTYSLGVAMSF